MSNDAIAAGWQRFLDRLKQLWGSTRHGDLTPLSTAMAIARGTARRGPIAQPAVTHALR